MTKLIAVLLLAAAGTVFTPQDAAARDCTGKYMGCIAKAGLLAEPFRSMKDVECGAGYAGCVIGKLKMW